MYAAQQKKIIILAILEILNIHTDAEHRLSAKEIIDRLDSEYGLVVDRKAVKRNLMDLIDFGYEIEYEKKERMGRQGEDLSVFTDWYINRTFDNSELRLLIDGLLFSKHIPYSQCKDLIGKLIGLSSKHFVAHVKHVYSLPENAPSNKAFFSIVDMLDEAIQKKNQVTFNYTEYGADKKKRLRSGASGAPIEYLVNPYQMVTANGRYYLIGNLDKYDDIAHYRVDRIANLSIVEKSKVKAYEKVTGGASLKQDLPKHMAEHIYMYSEEGVRVTFKAIRSIMSDIVDWFGLDFTVKELDDVYVEVVVKVNERAMFNWALQYGHCVEVLKPKSLRDRLAKTAADMAEKYK